MNVDFIRRRAQGISPETCEKAAARGTLKLRKV